LNGEKDNGVRELDAVDRLRKVKAARRQPDNVINVSHSEGAKVIRCACM